MTLKMLCVAAAAALVATPVLAQQPAAPPIENANRAVTTADLAGMREALRSSQKQTVAQNLRMTDAEATRFWPVYDKYAAELAKIRDAQSALIVQYVNTYGKYDDKTAGEFIAKWVDIDVQITALRAKYVPQVLKVLPGVKATTFFQIDRRTTMAIELKVVSGLPILQFQKGA